MKGESVNLQVVHRQTKLIVHIISGLGVGGAETMLYRLIQSRRGKGDEVHYVISLTDNCSFDFAALGVTMEILDLRRGFAPLTGLVKIRGALARLKPYIVQAWMYHGNIAAALASPRHIPVIWSIHHSLHGLKREKAMLRFLIKVGALLGRQKQICKIIYVSERSRMHHQAIGYPPEKGIVIPNGFDSQAFAPDAAARDTVRRQLGFDDNCLLVGNFGRYDPIKDYNLLLAAFAAVSKEFPRAFLLLAGRDLVESNNELVSKIHSLGLADHIVLLGPRTEMPRLYNALDLYVLSSKSESFPNVLGEAACCGIPAITTDVGDAALIVGDCGRVVPPSDPEALSHALREMLALSAGERRTLGKRAREHIMKHFGLPLVTKAYANLYDQVIVGNPQTQ